MALPWKILWPNGCFLALLPVKHILPLPPQLQKKLVCCGTAEMILLWEECRWVLIYLYSFHACSISRGGWVKLSTSG